MMFPTRFLSGLLFTVVCGSAAECTVAAGLSGVVLDSLTAAPVEKAKVQLDDGEQVCFTGADGHFAFPVLPAGEWALTVSRMGYKTRTGEHVTVAEAVPRELEIQLLPSAIIIPGQRVTGTRLDYDLFGLPVIVLTGSELLAAGYRDLPQALAAVPGLVVNTGYSTSGTPQVTVRGEAGKRLEFTLDGLSLAEGVRGEVDLSAIPVSAVENIEIHRGGQWGDAALGGSVNINTRRDFSSARAVSFEYGSFDERNISTTISGMAGSNYGYLLTGEIADRNSAYSYVDSLGQDVSRANSEFQIKKIYGKLGGRLAPEWDWGVSGLLHENNRGVPGTILYSTPAAEVKERRRLAGGNLSGVVGERLSVSVRSSLSDFRTLYRDTLSYQSHAQYDEAAYLLDAAVLFSPYENSPLTASAGGEVQHRQLTGQDFIAAQPAFDEASRTAEAVWGQVQVRPPYDLPAWAGSGRLTGGLRYDTDDRTPSYLAPRLGAVWGWGAPRVVNLSGSWGRSFRRPLLTSLFWEDAYTRGNPDLQPEKAREWDVKIEIIPPQTNLIVSTRFFDRSYDGFIEWAAGADWVWSPVNLPRATLVGREDGVSWTAFNQRLRLEFFHTLLWATDEAPGEYQGKFLVERPRHSYQANTRVHSLGFDLHLAARWEDRRYTNKDNTTWLPPYRWFDLTLRRTIPWEMLDPVFTVKCENLTNEAAALRDGYPLPGRAFKVGMELYF
jgi:outer membrane cobalamin receptor